jgi:hypothetical protein
MHAGASESTAGGTTLADFSSGFTGLAGAFEDEADISPTRHSNRRAGRRLQIANMWIGK